MLWHHSARCMPWCGCHSEDSSSTLVCVFQCHASGAASLLCCRRWHSVVDHWRRWSRQWDYNTPDTVLNLNPKYSDINYMSRFFLLMCNPQSCPAFSRPRNFGRRLLKFCPSFSSLSFARPLVFFVRHFEVVHFQHPESRRLNVNDTHHTRIRW